MGEKTVAISLTCSKRTDTMVKLHEMFESLNLKIITVNITAFSDRVLKTVFIEADNEEIDVLKIKIETAISTLNGLHNPKVTYLY
ncbi:transcription factor bHLH35 [Olea europaea subsp. europaea]|uniref:Transcription factor bHLH35 n=1 Tax=Olea europaea subsp. europaea TaxID=158383 RepID=A0A8S0SL20_OLEEU|nr:transcription factor bHLH35 [Olea europaea subsp. europaea]